MLQEKLMREQEIPSEQDVLLGRIFPPPRQLWYLTQRENWDGSLYWNIVQFVEVLRRLDPDTVRQAVKCLLQQHDSLQVRTRQDGADYYYIFAPLDDDIPFSYEDLSSVPEQDLAVTIESIAQNYQGSLNLIHGPLLRVVLFDPGPQKNQRLLFIVSHGACDAFSLQLLMRDFIAFYFQLHQGLPLQFPRKTTSIKEWTEIKSQYAQASEFQQELQYWRSLPWDKVRPLPVDYPENRHANTRGSMRMVTASLTPEETDLLQYELPKAACARVLDILLAALMYALKQWTAISTHAFFLVNHGRITSFPGVNLSRTVGNLITVPQIVLDAGTASTIEETLTTIKNQVHLIPSYGQMWEWLPVEMTLKSDLAFNYLGQLHSSKQTNGTSWFRPAPESAGAQDNPEEEHWTLISCTARISRKQFFVTWEFSENLYDRETVETLASEYISALRALLQERGH